LGGTTKPHRIKRIKSPKTGKEWYVPSYLVDYIEKNAETRVERRNVLPNDNWNYSRVTRVKKRRDITFSAEHEDKPRKQRVRDYT